MAIISKLANTPISVVHFPKHVKDEVKMEYKGYIGKVEIDEEAGVLVGEVINVRSARNRAAQRVKPA
ncbi:MAG: hypothetical protein L0Z70_04700 [Chloroflexi bacterium]|nr:hypothetical protein [Chloroflexota bacterium]